MPATPAEANRLTPYCRTAGKCHQRSAEREHDQKHIDGARKHAHLCVVLAGQKIVVDVEAEAPQIEIGGDMQRYDRSPADEADHGDRHQAGEQGRGFGGSGATGTATIIARISSAAFVRPRV